MLTTIDTDTSPEDPALRLEAATDPACKLETLTEEQQQRFKELGQREKEMQEAMRREVRILEDRVLGRR